MYPSASPENGAKMSTNRDQEMIVPEPGRRELGAAGGFQLPAIISAEGERTSKRFIEFFTANIRNPNTRAAYARAVGDFLTWCERRKLQLNDIEPIIVAAYIEKLTKER